MLELLARVPWPPLERFEWFGVSVQGTYNMIRRLLLVHCCIGRLGAGKRNYGVPRLKQAQTYT